MPPYTGPVRDEDPTAAPESAEADQPIVQSADRALHILELLADNGELGVSAIARALGVHRSTAFRLLVTLEARRFVSQEEHRGTYRLGAGALRIAGSVAVRLDLSREAQEVCDAVTAVLGETSNVAILDDLAAVNVAQATGSSSVAVRDQFVGQRTPLHATSSGKTLLAAAGEDVLRAVVAEPLERFSDTTITDPDALRSELERIRERGWGSAEAEWQEHVNAIAVPVVATDGSVFAALSTTAPAFRLPAEEFPARATVLREHADALSRRLGHLVPGTA